MIIKVFDQKKYKIKSWKYHFDKEIIEFDLFKKKISSATLKKLELVRLHLIGKILKIEKLNVVIRGYEEFLRPKPRIYLVLLI